MEESMKNRYLTARKGIIDRFFERMNPRQKEALYVMDGPVLIIAGAGSGKTTVIINRIANMVRFGDAYSSNVMPLSITEKDVLFLEACLASSVPPPEKALALVKGRTVPPQNILAITFTNKAAGELRERLAKMLGRAGSNITASTFHSACVKILRNEIDRIGYRRNFVIYDQDDSAKVVKNIIKEMGEEGKDFDPRDVISAIGRAKDRMMTPEDYRDSISKDDERLQAYATIYKLYQDTLRLANALDFDDLIMQTVRLFQQCPDVLRSYQEHYRYIMVDEYQDTNPAQFELVRLLGDRYRNICVVGDDDQSIYKFRGATIENILQFEDRFPGAQVFRLEQNYRSTSTILDAANAVIAHNVERRKKTLWTENEEGVKIHVYQAKDEIDECRYICEDIQKQVAAGKQYADFAVLYRTNAQSLVLERGMVSRQIPYRVVGGLRFYDRKEVKDMMAYLHVLINPEDNLHLRRIINVPTRGIGDVTVEKVIGVAQREGKSMFKVIEEAHSYPELKSRAAELYGFSLFLHKFMNRVGKGSIGDIMIDLASESGYMKMLTSGKNADMERKENIIELRSAIARYEETTDKPTLAGFLEEAALLSESESDSLMEDKVILMTVHASKGLEFDTVFIAGMDDGIFPHYQSIWDERDLEEERRLAYVAITRAKKTLHIIHAEERMMGNIRRRNDPSRFIEEIPETLRVLTLNEDAQWDEDFSAMTEDEVRALPSTLIPGDRVRSEAFGLGWVIASEPRDGDCLATVYFDACGEKQLSCASARLERV